MVAHIWQGLIVILLALSLVTGCASSPYVGTGAAVGGGLGAITGAAIGHRNPWAGALIGGLVGTGLGAGTGYLIKQRQAAQPPQGYNYPPGPPAYGYNSPPPRSDGYRAPAPGPSYGGYNTPNPVTPPRPQYSAAPAGPEYYSQNRAPQPSGVHTPITNAPYYPNE
jgi:hypothetical protein